MKNVESDRLYVKRQETSTTRVSGGMRGVSQEPMGDLKVGEEKSVCVDLPHPRQIFTKFLRLVEIETGKKYGSPGGRSGVI